MKKVIFSAFAFLFLFCGIAEAKRVVSVSMGRGEGKVTALKGTARWQTAGGGWGTLKPGQSLKGGEQVETGAGARLELTLPDASILRFAENTRFRIISIDMDESAGTRNAKINIALGKTWANVNKGLKVNPNIDVTSSNAVAGVRGTIYRMNVDEDQAVLVRVYDGQVSVEGGKGRKQEPKAPVLGQPSKISGPASVPGPHKVTMEQWVYIIKSMQQIRVSSTGIPSQPESFTLAEDRDEWVDWNRRRDLEVEGPAANCTDIFK